MPTLAALAFATPIWGFALQAPTAAPHFTTDIPLDAQVAVDATTDTAIESPEEARIRTELETRATMADWMTGLGIATVVSMAVTGVLGFIQFADRYGFHGEYNETACAHGTAAMQDFCSGAPWPHAIGGVTTAALFASTAIIGAVMPDPLHAHEQPNAYGARVQVHRTLHWFTLGMVIAQVALGGVISMSQEFGWLDRQNDFDVLQGLSIAHMALGTATLGTLAAQGALMIF